MLSGSILAIDQGTSSTKALLIATDGRVLGRAARSITTSHPLPGWAEQDGEEIWRSVVEVIDEIVALGHPIGALAITNQRETIGVWDEDGRPLAPFVLWQCRRTSDRCDAIRSHEPSVIERTGLSVDPMFSATKLAWLLDELPDSDIRIGEGRLKAGTIDSWLLFRLTGAHATDHTNASRTQLMNLDSLDWDPALGELFGVPLSILPTIQPSRSDFGRVREGLTRLPDGVPVLAMLGDSHAAAYGHGLEGRGQIKATCGTGSSLMTVTGARVRSTHGLSGTVAWSRPGEVLYALEGNIVVSGQTLVFAAQLLGLTDHVALLDLAATVPDAGGVVFVPAMAGLGAPHWNADARGAVVGMTLASTPAHVARAAVEAVGLQIHDVFRAMEADLDATLPWIGIDGGAAARDAVAQVISDVLRRPVRRPRSQDLSAFGAARLAAEGLGQAMPAPTDAGEGFEPRMSEDDQRRLLGGWRTALGRVTIPAAGVAG